MFDVDGVDVRGLVHVEKMLEAVGKDGPRAVSRAMNHTGDRSRTAVVRELSRQSGLPQKVIRRAVEARRAALSDLEYRLRSGGGDVALKHFRKRETREGVRARLGAARGIVTFENAFFRGGLFPGRRVDLPKLGGHVFRRDGGRTNLAKLRSGVVIPAEMIDGATRAAFEKTVQDRLPSRLEHELGRLFRA